ncbi:Eco57I restriction-modification methylase domain-containing protein [Bifidobacterium sp. MA2]|uniref:site-specific DNA-methyltransferase (adenine-specific) n=1 Tax=Bifidobacterium santillanense TaxID=2809028 RepID=A0ABS5ULQ0_9BIFI|nr:Eco57I restriction-modification methylase domain-containing protein [Bifidobacterium santillanense]
MYFGDKPYNPDVLSCLANLSNDEVFTPPEVANKILDLLPEKIWSDSSVTFLDPFTKTGVFLREITRRLLIGLEPEFPNLQERINHILNYQIWGIAITELTALLSRRTLYCSKKANGKYSIDSLFDDPDGHIRYKAGEHLWAGDRCHFCGASKQQYDRDSALESYTYEFIHTPYPERIFNNMQFDVIVGNPPYQLSDGGYGKSAAPIYQKFVEQAKKLNPRYLSMIIPSRWFSGGRGLDEFRAEMLSDKHIRELTDYESFKEVFPGVDLAGGACYFLWDRDDEGSCKIVNIRDGKRTKANRFLDEFPVFVRDNKAVDIIRRIRSIHEGRYLDDVVSSSKPFGLRTFYKPTKSGVPCHFIQRIGDGFANPEDVTDQFQLLNKWKLLIPRSPIAGQTDFSKAVKFYSDQNTAIVPPGMCCTESFLVAYAADSKEEVLSFKSYLFTKVARFLLLQAVASQDVTKRRFLFVPDLGKYDHIFTDNELCSHFDLTDEDWEYIDSRISETDQVK